MVDDVFDENPPGDFGCGLPSLRNVERSDRKGKIQTGQLLFDDTPAVPKLRAGSTPTIGNPE